MGLVLRLFVSPFGTLTLDHNTFVAWSNSLTESGLSSFYNGWSDYLPGYVYVLWVLGSINKLLQANTDVLYKLPAIFADLATGYLIYKIIYKTSEKKSKNLALLGSAIYIFNPAIWANSSLWGQVDSLTALFSLLAVYLANINPVFSAISLSLGTLVKPQAALAAIPILFIVWRDRWRISKLLTYGLVGGILFVLGFVPFYNDIGNPIWRPDGLPNFILSRLDQTLNQYPYTSVNAFNFWGLSAFWQPDTWQNIVGWVLVLVFSAIASFKLRKNSHAEYLLLAWVMLVGFLFMTRLHERHLLPVLAPLAVSISLYPSLVFSYAILSFVYTLNLYYAYIWITQEFREIFSQIQVIFLIFLNLVASAYFGAVLWIKKEFLISSKFAKLFQFSKPETAELVDKISTKKLPVYLGLILAFALFTRIFMLHNPAGEYFDEVYHAFTARAMLVGDPKSWEWWNPNPEGFAYEWTHPPLAKQAMVVGMSVFGETAFGWRIVQALLGVGAVGLICLISKEIFKSRDVGLLSALVFCLDGLPLVMSRIGMNDMYLLFFMLLTFWLFLKDKYLFASISLGLAVASKWSIMWFGPVLVLAIFVLKRKFKWQYLWLGIIPPLVYLGSYIPFFTSGHTVDQFIELQKQMWWYHTRLVAEHSYTSAWWSWPFNLRPVWAYVNRDVGNLVANIYIQGNPIIFWTGLVALIGGAYTAFVEKNKKLGFIIFAYFAMFATWAVSPRIMFFYHYLPSFAFMSIILGFMLKRNTWAIKPVLILGLISFIYFYPHWTGIQIPVWLDNSYYWLSTWR